MKKVTILALHLGAGGIERITTMLANNLCKNYNVEIVSTYKLFNKPFFELDKRVKVKYLLPDLKPNKKEFKDAINDFRFIKAFKEGMKALKILKLRKSTMIDYIKKCDSEIIISTRDIFNELLGKYGSKYTKKIGWEHNHHNDNKKYIKKIVKSVKNLDYFVLVSKELCAFYQDKVKAKCVYIPNCIDHYPDSLSSLDGKNILAVGRLSEEKDPLELVEVFNIVHKKFPDWKLNIVGSGVLEDALEDKIEELNLKDNVIMHGYRNRDYINELLKDTSVFLTTSKTESFGIVVLEAFAYGVPCVAYSSAQGIKEIVSNHYDAFLINDRNREVMAKRIMELIKNKNRRVIMGDYAFKTSLKYKDENICKIWIDLIENKSLKGGKK